MGSLLGRRHISFLSSSFSGTFCWTGRMDRSTERGRSPGISQSVRRMGVVVSRVVYGPRALHLLHLLLFGFVCNPRPLRHPVPSPLTYNRPTRSEVHLLGPATLDFADGGVATEMYDMRITLVGGEDKKEMLCVYCVWVHMRCAKEGEDAQTKRGSPSDS